jgi:hypothetical protein
MELTVTPSPPVVGEANVAIVLAQPDGIAIRDAKLNVEGNMNHAGMKPSLAELKETQPGRYEGKLDFTMGGDWFLLVTAILPDGSRVERRFDVPAVKSE